MSATRRAHARPSGRRDPSLVEDVAEDAMTGDADADGYQDDDGDGRSPRFQRRPDGAAVLTR